MRFRFSRRAEADLEMIASYIGRNNPSRALSIASIVGRFSFAALW
jgi:plasmid stabilization system protein ParE